MNSPNLNLAFFRSSLYKKSSWTLQQKANQINRNKSLQSMPCNVSGRICKINVNIYHNKDIRHLCKHSQIIWEAPGYRPNLPVSRTGHQISLRQYKGEPIKYLFILNIFWVIFLIFHTFLWLNWPHAKYFE